jgi:hypothetical protein
MVDTRSYSISLAEFTTAFVPFAVLLGAALLAGEASLDPGFARTVYTIWVAAVLVTPALCAFALPGDSHRKRTTWLLFWTLSFIAYVVHMGYAIFAAYHSSWREFVQGQGVFPAIVNVVFTALWATDVSLSWFYHREAHWLRVERIATHVFVGLTFIASTVFLKHGFVNVIGVMLTGSIIVCLAMRYDAGRSRAVSPVRIPDGVTVGDPFRTRVRPGGVS